MFGAKVIGVVGNPVDHDLRAAAGYGTRRAAGSSRPAVAAAVAYLDPHRDGVFLFGVIGAFGPES